MKYFLALVTAFFLVAVMFAFRAQMLSNVAAWEAANVTISPFEKTLVSIADGVSRYWYAFVPLIIIACFAIAALIPKRRADEQPEQPT
jgi:type II secretory pathway component PulF